MTRNDLKSRRRFIVLESIFVLVALAAGIAIVATFHRGTKVVVVSGNSTSSTSTGGSGSTDSSGSSTGSTAKGSQTTGGGSGGTTQLGSATTSGIPPKGVVGFDQAGCDGCGQTPSPGARCSGWLESFTNSSDTEVTGITVDPPSGKFQTGTVGSSDYHTWPTPDPASVTLNIAIPASQSQKVRFVTCTPMAPPTPNAEFFATAPATFTWRWITGQTGKACFGSACG